MPCQLICKRSDESEKQLGVKHTYEITVTAYDAKGRVVGVGRQPFGIDADAIRIIQGGGPVSQATNREDR